MKKKIFSLMMIFLIPAVCLMAAGKKSEVKQNDREYWVDLLCKIAEPVLSNMSEGKLSEKMQVEVSPTWDGRDKGVTYMECFGRLMSGIAPWLTLPDDNSIEGIKRSFIREWALKSYAKIGRAHV